MIGSSNQLAQLAQTPDIRASVSVAIVEHNLRIQRANPGCSGPNYTLVCESCKRLFQAPTKLSGWQRTSFEYETLRRVLLIADHTAMPVFCDPCYEQAVVPPEQRAMSFPNLVLGKGE